MNDFETKMNVLHEILQKKKDFLTAISVVCENMENMFLQPPSPEKTTFLRQMGEEKQKLIDQVIHCDDIFQGMFDGMKEEFSKEAESHLSLVAKLQNGIKEVMELDVKIRAQEDKNKVFFQRMAAMDANKTQSLKPVPKPTIGKNYLLDQYKKNNGPEDEKGRINQKR